MATIHNLGFSRIGPNRELKQALEQFWSGQIDEDGLNRASARIRHINWQLQSALDMVTVGDFSLYDHVLDTSYLVGNIPKRAKTIKGDIHQCFGVARGRSVEKQSKIKAGDMTKWFDTNYHYIVPEFDAQTTFSLQPDKLLAQVKEATLLKKTIKVVVVGPVTYLKLGAWQEGVHIEDLGKKLASVYRDLFVALKQAGVDWVQIDEPVLVTDLDPEWKQLFATIYTDCFKELQDKSTVPKILLATYFGSIGDNLSLVKQGLYSNVLDGVHVDAVRGSGDIGQLVEHIQTHQVLSAGVIDGRNIWKANLEKVLTSIDSVAERLGERLWIAPSCSLLHVPVDCSIETKIPSDILDWLSFGVQKINELRVLKQALGPNKHHAESQLLANKTSLDAKKQSALVHDTKVKKQVDDIKHQDGYRPSIFKKRKPLQNQALGLPICPTTTIGSFPQTAEIRKIRRAFKQGHLSQRDYETKIKQEIESCIKIQEDIGLDVLVHGEAERNDMVEYFGEQLNGFSFTSYGWVQSYGSRCVKPPIIYGDVSRPSGMTVNWIQFAQSQTKKPVKGMLTGPVTILNWSFVRDDQPRSETCLQLAVALRDEVNDLEASGVRIIQIDEAALREGLPLRVFRMGVLFKLGDPMFSVTASQVQDTTQIHTHMCYSNFNDIIDAIISMDADVITIESSRSNNDLLKAFERRQYPNDIGPGVYDIHSPNVPDVSTINQQLALINTSYTLVIVVGESGLWVEN